MKHAGEVGGAVPVERLAAGQRFHRAEQMLVIIEIKGTSWDTIPAERVRPNLRRHLRQLQGYLNTATEEMDAGQWPGGIAGALLYPARPSRAATAEMIEALAGEQAIMVTWYLEADWGQ
jgi:hypothetical protein